MSGFKRREILEEEYSSQAVMIKGNTNSGVPNEYSKQTASGETYLIQKGQLNNLRQRQQIMNEQCESSRDVQSVVTAGNIVGQIFKASQDNINGINLTMESAAGEIFDDFESYADDAALQAVWVSILTGAEFLPDIEVATVFEGNQSMYLPTSDGSVLNEIAKAFVSKDYESFSGNFQMYSNKEYKDVKMRIFFEDGLGNTSSRQIVQSNKNVWTKVEFSVDGLTEDVVGSPADLTNIVKIGFLIEKSKRDGYVIFDIMGLTPAPGEVEIKLWDMGTVLPVSGAVALDSGTQYEKLGDLGISGQQLSSVNVSILGGKRMYHIDEFIAGVALEIPSNEALVPGNYYAITIHYVDTNISVYGANQNYGIEYYKNGYAFNAPNEASNIVALGEHRDLQFIIFSTQDAYIFEVTVATDGIPNGNSETTFYVEDKDMKRTDVLVSGIKAVPVITTRLERPFLIMKGAKIEQEYNDDLTDTVKTISIIVSYFFIPPIVNG